MYALVNEGNIKTLTKELLDYLKVSDVEFKPDLTSKICMLVQRFAPDKQWHLDSLLQVGLNLCAAHLSYLSLPFGSYFSLPSQAQLSQHSAWSAQGTIGVHLTSAASPSYCGGGGGEGGRIDSATT